MMARRHYIAVAKIIADCTDAEQSQYIGKAKLVSQLARMFDDDNDRFVSSKFREACYTESAST